MALHPSGHAKLLRMRARAGDFGGDLFPRALKAQLDMVDSRADDFLETLLIERKARRNQAGVEAGAARGADKLGESGRASGSPPVKST